MADKLLLVEDERAQRLLYKQVLEEEGYQVFDAKNGGEALEIVMKHDPDLAILDIRLIGEDGLDLMGKLLSINPDLPVILHTAYAVWKDNFRGRLADAYVIKSSDMEELKAKVRELLADRTASA